MNPLHSLARPEILALKPYSHAAWLPPSPGCMPMKRRGAPPAIPRLSGSIAIRNPTRRPHRTAGGALRGTASYVLATRGADEAIDLLSRIYLAPNQTPSCS